MNNKKVFIILLLAPLITIVLTSCGSSAGQSLPTATKFVFPPTLTTAPEPTITQKPTLAPSPTPAGNTTEDRYYIEKCHRWQNVRLGVLENDKLDVGVFDEIVIVQDVYYFDAEGDRVERNHGSGSFGEFPLLVVRFSQNEVSLDGKDISNVDKYYIDYQVKGPNQQLTDTATVTMIVNEPMSSGWCQDNYASAGYYHQVSKVPNLFGEGEITGCGQALIDWMRFYLDIQNRETAIIDKVNTAEDQHIHNFNTYNDAGWQTRTLYDEVISYKDKDHECVVNLNTHLAMETHYLLSAFNNACKSNVYEAQNDFYMNDKIRIELQMMIAAILPEGWDQ